MNFLFLSLFLAIVVSSCSGAKLDIDTELDITEDDKLYLSLNNNNLTSGSYSQKNAKRFYKESKKNLNPNNQSISSLISLIASNRLAFGGTKKAVELYSEMGRLVSKRGVDTKMPSVAKIELAYTAYIERNYGLTLFLVDELINSENKKYAAAAYNLQALIFQKFYRTPEAIESWKRALDLNPRDAGSLVNYGFTALRSGDFKMARKLLSKVSGTWFTKLGLMIANRFTGEIEEAKSTCSDLIDSHPTKMVYYNCGIFYYQNGANSQKAKEYISKALGMAGGPSDWNKDGRAILKKIKTET